MIYRSIFKYRIEITPEICIRTCDYSPSEAIAERGRAEFAECNGRGRKLRHCRMEGGEQDSLTPSSHREKLHQALAHLTEAVYSLRDIMEYAFSDI